jgi:hypothetical protein
MWVGGDTLMLLAMIPVAIRWVRREDRRAVMVDRELDRIMVTPHGTPVAVQHEERPNGAPAPRVTGRSGWRAFLPPSEADGRSGPNR